MYSKKFLKKIFFGPKFSSDLKSFQTQNSLGHKFFRTNLLNPKFCWTSFFWNQLSLDSKNLWTQNFWTNIFEPTFFLDPKIFFQTVLEPQIFWTKTFLDPKLDQEFDCPKIFLDQHFFGTQILFDLKTILKQNLFSNKNV